MKRADTGQRAQDQLGQIALDTTGHTDVLLVACSEVSMITAGISANFEDSLEVFAQAIVDFAAEESQA